MAPEPGLEPGTWLGAEDSNLHTDFSEYKTLTVSPLTN